jgi:Type II secretion system (T2SS), protein E, N-terminal domain
MKLGTMLLRDGVINLDQLEAALRAQVLFGGKLGTNLVELGHLTLDQLSHYLGRTLGIPPATQEHFEAAQPAAISMLPRAVAERHVVFAISVEPGTPPKLHLALAEPRDKAALAAVREATGAEVVPHVAPELRILFYLERHYGVQRKVRFVRVAPAEGVSRPPPGEGERRRFVGAQGTGTDLVVPPGIAPPKIEPRRGTYPPVITTEKSAPIVVAPPSAAPVAATIPDSGPILPVSTSDRPIGLADTLARLEEARTRDSIADALLRFARGRLEACVLFLLRERLALGWRGFAPGVPSSELESFSLQLAAASCLAAAHETRAPWRGKPGGALDANLFARLRLAAPPLEVLTAPISIGARVVNLLYAHGADGRHLDDGVVDGLLSVAEAAGEAYARLIQQTKRA